MVKPNRKFEILQIEGMDELTLAVHYLKDIDVWITKTKIKEAIEIVKRDKIIFLKVTVQKVPYIKKTMVTAKFLKKSEVQRICKFREYVRKIRDSDNTYLAENTMRGISVFINLTLIGFLVWVVFFRFDTAGF